MRDHLMARIRLLTLPLTAASLLALAACSKSPNTDAVKPKPETADAGQAHGDGHAESGEEEAAGPLKLDDDEMEAAGIRLETLQPSGLSEELRAAGEVVDTGYGTTLITPQVEALVVRRHAKLGDEVRAGAPLVTLASVAVSDAQAELRIAEQEWRRVSALGREAVAGRRISEAKVAVDRARAKAQAYGLPGTASDGVNGQFTLTAPHVGRITEDEFVVGERIEPGKALFRLVDESVVWVDAKLQAGTAPRIRPGQEAVVLFGGERLAGTVQQAAHRTSNTTRNAVVRIKVPNKDDRLHGGDFVDVFFEAVGGPQVDHRDATELAVPNEALVQLAGDTVVFRRNADGALEPVPVRTGEVIGERTLIRDGLKSGDTVVVAGAFELKSQMLKSQLGEEE